MEFRNLVLYNTFFYEDKSNQISLRDINCWVIEYFSYFFRPLRNPPTRGRAHMRKFRGCFLINAAKVAPPLLEVLSHGVVGLPKKDKSRKFTAREELEMRKFSGCTFQRRPKKREYTSRDESCGSYRSIFAMRARERERDELP